MKLSEIYKSTVPVLSFEVFPPKPEVPLENVMRLIGSLKQYSPSYISVTYGAGAARAAGPLKLRRASNRSTDWSLLRT